MVIVSPLCQNEDCSELLDYYLSQTMCNSPEFLFCLFQLLTPPKTLWSKFRVQKHCFMIHLLFQCVWCTFTVLIFPSCLFLYKLFCSLCFLSHIPSCIPDNWWEPLLLSLNKWPVLVACIKLCPVSCGAHLSWGFQSYCCWSQEFWFVNRK